MPVVENAGARAVIDDVSVMITSDSALTETTLQRNDGNGPNNIA